MSEFNNPATKTATSTFDISYAELDGANRGQRPDLLVKEQCNFRTPDGMLWSNVAGVLAPADNRTDTVIIATAIPVILPSSGSMAANGAVTFGTSLFSGGGFTFPQPAFCFFPAGAVYAGSVAGVYYVNLLSTTTGQVFDNVLAGVPVVPPSPKAIVAAGPGAYTQLTTLVTLVTIPIAGGTLGPNGSIWVDYTIGNYSSADSKNHGARLNAIDLMSNTNGNPQTTLTGARVRGGIMNRGRVDRQFAFPYASYAASNLTTDSSLNTANTQPLTFWATLATGGAWVRFEQITATVTP